jgi:drug/metabolite transporter (DMT)-like permease
MLQRSAEFSDLIQGLVFLVLAQTMVGVNIVTSKLLLSSIPVLVLLEIRFLLATLVLLPLHWTTAASRKKSLNAYFSELRQRDWFFILTQALSAGILFNTLMLTGLNYTDANVAGIITSALPAIIAILSWLILHEKISAEKALCILFATIGLVIIAYNKLQGIGDAHSFFGDSIILLALLPEASYYVLCKLYANRLPLFLTSALLNGINPKFGSRIPSNLKISLISN